MPLKFKLTSLWKIIFVTCWSLFDLLEYAIQLYAVAISRHEILATFFIQ